jgi:hypothetical protein
MTWPDKVLIYLPLERSFRRTPIGRLDFFMTQQEAPESKRMQNNYLLRIVPTVLTMYMVAGVSFLNDFRSMKTVFNVIFIEDFIDFKNGYQSVPYRIIISGIAQDGTICPALWKSLQQKKIVYAWFMKQSHQGCN